MLESIKRFFQECFESDFLIAMGTMILVIIIFALLDGIRTDNSGYTDAIVRLYLSGHEEESEGYHVIVKNGNVIVINSEGKYVTTKENWR